MPEPTHALPGEPPRWWEAGWPARLRFAALVVLLATLLFGGVGERPAWATALMAVCALGLGATRVVGLVRRLAGARDRPGVPD